MYPVVYWSTIVILSRALGYELSSLSSLSPSLSLASIFTGHLLSEYAGECGDRETPVIATPGAPSTELVNGDDR
jgi:hypothetical protein